MRVPNGLTIAMMAFYALALIIKACWVETSWWAVILGPLGLFVAGCVAAAICVGMHKVASDAATRAQLRASGWLKARRLRTALRQDLALLREFNDDR